MFCSSLLMFLEELSVNASVDTIMKKRMHEAGDQTSPAVVPVPKQIYNAKTYLKNKILPSGDVFQNIATLFPDFVRRMQWT